MAGNETLLPGGGRLVAGTSPVTGQFYGIQPWTDTVISAITLAPGFTGASNATTITLSAGAVYNIRFTSITLSSGTAMLFESA